MKAVVVAMRAHERSEDMHHEACAALHDDWECGDGSVEMFAEGRGVAVTNQPLLSCGRIAEAAAIAVDESNSAAGQVLLLGGVDEDQEVVPTVHLVDLVTGSGAGHLELHRADNVVVAC